MPGVFEEISVTFKGMQQNTEKMAKMLESTNKMLKLTVITTALWQGLDTLLKPVLTMMKLLFTILFLPMMPLLKKMLIGLAETAKNVARAQDEAGGGMLGFAAGVAELFKSPTIWAVVGAAMATNFLSSLGTKTIAGTLIAGIGLSVVWDTIAKADSSSLVDKLKGSFASGVAIGIAALMLGMPFPGAILLGLVTFGITFGISLSYGATEDIKEGNAKNDIWKKLQGYFKNMFGGAFTGAALGAGIGAGVGALGGPLTAGAGALIGGTVGVSIGFIVSLFADVNDKIDTKKTKGMVEGKKSNLLGLAGLAGGGLVGMKVGRLIGMEQGGNDDTLKKTKETESLFSKMLSSITGMWATNSTKIQTENEHMLGKEKKSQPMQWLLIETGKEWQNMAKISIVSVSNIIKALNKIPRKIVTIHEIKTIHTNG